MNNVEVKHYCNAFGTYRSLYRPTFCGEHHYLTTLTNMKENVTCKECLKVLNKKEDKNS